MNRILFFFLAQLISLFLYSQRNPAGLAGGMGNARLSNKDFWARLQNPSSLPDQKNLHFGMSAYNSYLIKELSAFSLGIEVPVSPQKNSFSALYTQSGSPYLKTKKLAIGYGQQLTKKGSIGVLIDYYLLGMQFEMESNLHYLTFEFCGQYHLKEGVTFSFLINNPPLLSKKNLPFESSLHLGLLYQINKNLSSLFEISKSLFHPLRFQFGLAYSLSEKNQACLGMSTHPTFFTIGYGRQLGKWRVDASAQLHLVLGLYPCVSLVYGI